MVNNIDKTIANESKVMVPPACPDLVSRENRSQSPDTVVGECSRDRSFAPSVSKARSGRIPLVGSNIDSFSYRKARGRLFEDVT